MMLQVMGHPQEPVVKIIQPKFHNHNPIDFAPEHLHQKLSGRNLLTCLLMRARFSVTDSSSESYSVQKTQSKDSSSRRTLLQRLNIQASVQIKKKPGGYRYDKDIGLLHFAMYSYIQGGRKFYEVLSANFEGVFPSCRTIERKLSSFPKSVPEGEVNVALLKEILEKHRLPPVVSIAEDGTAIVGQREYDKRTNRVIGFSLPLRCNGINFLFFSMYNECFSLKLNIRRISRFASFFCQNRRGYC